MEKTFGQIEETKNDVPQTQSNPDETSEAVANLTSILERSKSPAVIAIFQFKCITQ